MRILLATESFGWSGGAAQTLALARGLRSRGHDVWLACEPEGEIGRRAAAEGLALLPARFRGDADFPAVFALLRRIRSQRIEILHAQHPKAHGVGLLAAALAGPALKLLVTRRVSFPVGTNIFSRWKYGSRRIDAFVAVSGGIRDVLVRGGAPAERVRVIYSGIDPRTFRPAAPEALERLRSSLGLARGIPVVIKVANFSDWKGQDVFLDAAALAMKRGIRAQFVLAGRETDGAACRGLVERLGVRDHVRLLGFRRDVADLLALSALSVNAASGGEGLSGAMRESLALGVPVAAADVSGNRELVVDGETGWLVPPRDPAALAAAIEAALADPPEAARRAARGRERVLREFTVERMVEKTEALYRSLLDRQMC